MAPLVSVVVPVRDRAAALSRCLRALVAQDLSKERHQVVVVDDGSADESATIAEAAGALVVRTAARGIPSARNEGIHAAGAEWVAFTDSDCAPSRGWLRCLLQATSQGPSGGVLGVAGRTVGMPSSAPAAQYFELAGGFHTEAHLAHPTFPFAPTNNVLYRRQALLDVGGFDERFRSYEGCDLLTRLRRAGGGAVVYEPRAIVLHEHRGTWRQYWRQQRSYGSGLAQFMLCYRREAPWSAWRELQAWAALVPTSLMAALPGSGDRALLRRGDLVRTLALRVGFRQTYWNEAERTRW
jgi:glycosyltransferase involved in cell wall biosynthesis